MKPNRLILLLTVTLAAIAAVVFWPADTLAPQQHEEAESSDSPLDLAEFDGKDGSKDAVLADEIGEVGEERHEVEVEDVGETSTDEQKEKPYAELLVRLYGENDAYLEGATAGILLMPEPGQDFNNLQPLFFAMQGQAPKSFALNEVETNEKGEAVLPLPNHKHGWVVYGRAFGRLVGFKVLQNLAADERHDAGVLVLRRGGTLQVEVADGLGKPIADASVVLISEDNSDPTEMPIHFLRTGADGIALFNALNFASYEMDVAKPGYLFIDKQRVAITERGNGLEQVVLHRGGSLTGQVIDEKGIGLAGVPVSIRAEQHKHRPQGLTEELMSDQQWAVSGADGQFEGAGLVEGASYFVRAEPSAEAAVQSKGHKVGDHVTLKVNPVVMLRGRVLQADGQPAVGASVGMQAANYSAHIKPLVMRTAADGSFEGEVYRGNYRMVIHHESGEMIHPKVLRLNQATELPDFKLPAGGALEVRFIQPDGTPAEQVYLSRLILPQHEGADKTMRGLLSRLERLRRTDVMQHEDTIRVRGLNPGPVTMRFHAPGYLDPVLKVEVKSDELGQHEYRLERGGTLNLTITGPADFKPRRVAYELRYLDPLAERHQFLRTQLPFTVKSDGSRQHKRLIPGTWGVFVKDDINPDLGATPGAELGRFTVLAGEQSQRVEIR